MIKESAELIAAQSYDVKQDCYEIKGNDVLVRLKPTSVDFEGEGTLVETEIFRFTGDISDYALRLLLAVNIGFEYTQGTTLGVLADEPEDREKDSANNKQTGSCVILSKIFSSSIDTGEKLAVLLAHFIELANNWKAQIESITKEPEKDIVSSKDTLANIMMI